MHGLISYLEGLFLFTGLLFALTLATSLLKLGPAIKHKTSLFKKTSKGVVVLLFASFLLASFYSAFTIHRPMLWTYVFAVLVASIAWLLALPMIHVRRGLLVFYSVCIPLLILAVSLAINGPAPITQDEGRFTRFAFTIADEGRWVPYKHGGNAYYQFFHVTPFLRATFSMVTGLDLVRMVNPVLVGSIALLAALGIYLLASTMLKGKEESLRLSALAPILFLITPSLFILGFIPQGLTTSLFITALVLVVKGVYTGAFGRKLLILIILLSAAGVMVHGVYPMLLLPSMAALLVARAGSPHVSTPVKSSVYIVGIFTLVYWLYTYVLDQMISMGRMTFSSIYSFLFGTAEPFSGTRPVWYFQLPPEQALPWALLPALTAAFIVLRIIKQRGKILNALKEPAFVIGVLGLAILGVGFLSRATPYSIHRHLYPGYALLILPSILAVKEVLSKRRILNISLILIIVASTSFYAVQDPALSPEVQKLVLVADKRSWIVASTLAPYLLESSIPIVDPRLNIGLEALKCNSTSSFPTSKILLLSFDRRGEQWMDYRLVGEMGMKSLIDGVRNQQYPVVYSDGLYIAFYIQAP